MNTEFYLANDRELDELGISGANENEQYDRLKEQTGRLMKFSRSLRTMLDSCVRCGACAKACHSYLGTGDSRNIPAVRARLLGDFIQRHFTLTGRILDRFTDRPEPDGTVLADWLKYFYQCTLCHRCAYYCPLGIDTAEITMAARYILANIGLVPEFIANIMLQMDKTGNNMGILKPAIVDCCEFLEEEIKEETGLDIKIPVDKPRAEVLYVPSSTEFLVNVDTLIGVAKVFHVLGLDWTISSAATEAANYGLFANLDLLKRHNARLLAAARTVGAGLVVQGECGHGWRVAKMYTEGANAPVPFKLRHILELVADNLAVLPLRKLPWRVTLHDPCNYARAGDLIEQPRTILKACVNELVEMTPNREFNYCCGGGSGLLMDEMLATRMKLAKMKAEQIRALGPVGYIVAPCASCKAQLPKVIENYQLGNIQVAGVMEIVGKALRLETGR